MPSINIPLVVARNRGAMDVFCRDSNAPPGITVGEERGTVLDNMSDREVFDDPENGVN